jgi:hypothetical protein
MRLALCPENGRIYACGGDYIRPGQIESGRQEVWSCDPRRPSQWVEEYPYEGMEGDVMPSGPDEVTWCWDALRRVFWLVPGFMYPPRPRMKAIPLGGHIMTFDPRARKWADVKRIGNKDHLARVTHGVHVAATDELHRFAWHGGGGMVVNVIDCRTLQESIVAMRSPAGNNDRLNAEYHAWNGEEIFAVSNNHGRCFAWNPVQRRVRVVCEGLPVPANPLKDDGRSMLFWNTRIQRLEFYHLLDLRGYVEGLWLIDPVSGSKVALGKTFSGRTIHGNVGVHVPEIGTLVLGGHLTDPSAPGGWREPPYICLVAVGIVRPAGLSPAVAQARRGTWEAVPINAHPRVVPVFKDVAHTDAAVPRTRAWVPKRAYSHAVMGRDGLLYYHGGAHGNYPGNEVDVFDTRTLTWRTPDRPRVPPPGDSMYASGGTLSVWRDATTGEWQPYSIHGYGRQSWLPDLGYVAVMGGLVGIESDGAARTALVLCSWTPAARWRTHGWPHPSNVRWLFNLSEYDDQFDGLLAFGSDGSRTLVSAFSLADRRWSARANIAGSIVNPQSGSGGAAIHYLERGRHLILRTPQAGKPAPTAMFIYSGEQAQEIPIPAGHHDDIGPTGALFAAVDRDGRRVFFAHPVAGVLKLWVADFDALSQWRALAAAPAPAFTQPGTSDRMPLHFHDGWLYLIVDGGNDWQAGIRMYRMAV